MPATVVSTAVRPPAYPSILAMYDDGGLLIRASFPLEQARIAVGNPNAESVSSLLIRTSSSHQFVTFVPSIPPRNSDPCDRRAGQQASYGPIAQSIPFCEDLRSGVSPDGQRVAYVSTTVPATNPAAIRVTQFRFGARDTTYSGLYRVPTIAVSREQADSARADRRSRLSGYAEPAHLAFSDSILEHEMPAYRTPVDEVYVGNDGTVMLTLLRFTSARSYLLIDSRGNAVGTFSLPTEVLPLEIRGTTIYGLVPRPNTTRSQNLNDIVRYQIR
jgi:hypothetical protein